GGAGKGTRARGPVAARRRGLGRGGDQRRTGGSHRPRGVGTRRGGSPEDAGGSAVGVSYWLAVRDGDPRALALYLRHYSARKNRGPYRIVPVGNRARFVGNGEHIVLLTPDCRSLFAWRWQRRRRDRQTGVECCVFRREGPGVASEMVAEA